MRFFVTTAALWVLILAACGLLNGFAAHAGIERAADQTSQELATKADKATKDWLDYLIYGVLPGVVAGFAGGKTHERRRQRKAKPPA